MQQRRTGRIIAKAAFDIRLVKLRITTAICQDPLLDEIQGSTVRKVILLLKKKQNKTKQKIISQDTHVVSIFSTAVLLNRDSFG